MIKTTRGEQRFASVTYSVLARWTGYTVSTVRSYANRGQFDPMKFDETLQWVAEVCERRGRRPPWSLVLALPNSDKVDTCENNNGPPDA